jgi:hypothetical protein
LFARAGAQRAQLLQFCTGSARAPATGFAALMGYGGNQQRFTLQRVRPAAAEPQHLLSPTCPHPFAPNPPHPRPNCLRLQVPEEGGRLPTASTCFNTLRLPAYASEAALAERLRVALANSEGFDEHAVAE